MQAMKPGEQFIEKNENSSILLAYSKKFWEDTIAQIKFQKRDIVQATIAVL